LATHDTSPLTGAVLPSKLLVPNLPLRQLILASAAAGDAGGSGVGCAQ
jgi:hypothetical protein